MMKITAMLSMILVFSVLTPAVPPNRQDGDDAFTAFAEKFRAAVKKGDQETIIKLSQFPIRMPGRVRSIKNAADLRLRYRDVFNKYTNAAMCFADPVYGKASQDSDNPKVGGITCDSATADWVSYNFKLTNTGWKFVQLSRDAMAD